MIKPANSSEEEHQICGVLLSRGDLALLFLEDTVPARHQEYSRPQTPQGAHNRNAQAPAHVDQQDPLIPPELLCDCMGLVGIPKDRGSQKGKEGAVKREQYLRLGVSVFVPVNYCVE